LSNDIVVINVSETVSPAPSTLQQTGALITQGGTTTAAQTLTLCSALADVTAILAPGKALTSLAWSTGVVTATTTAPHGWTNGDVITATISGASPAGYNGTFPITISGASTFTYALVSDPGSETVPGTVTLGAVDELTQMATTYFAQTGAKPVYVLELGEGTAAEGVTDLTTFITANPSTIYSYLVPREWDAESTFHTFIGNYASTTSKTYFFVTTTSLTYSNYTAKKSVLCLVESPNKPATEFSLAAVFAVTLRYAPSSSNKVPPLAFSFVYGVTAYPLTGNATLLNTFKAANVNYIDTAAEGGLSNTVVKWGHVMDGKPFNYWYSVDWAQINIHIALANEVINGSNSTLAPLYYDQNGINRLQNRARQTIASAVTYGLATGSVVLTQLSATQFATNFENGDYAGQLAINAEPFAVYTQENPSDYAAGTYGGLAATYTPSRGFESIVFNLNVVF